MLEKQLLGRLLHDPCSFTSSAMNALWSAKVLTQQGVLSNQAMRGKPEKRHSNRLQKKYPVISVHTRICNVIHENHGSLRA